MAKRKETNSEDKEEMITLVGDIESVTWGDFRPMTEEDIGNKEDWENALGHLGYQLIVSFEGEENGE